jgi:hypothetical protein
MFTLGARYLFQQEALKLCERANKIYGEKLCVGEQPRNEDSSLSSSANALRDRGRSSCSPFRSCEEGKINTRPKMRKEVGGTPTAKFGCRSQEPRTETVLGVGRSSGLVAQEGGSAVTNGCGVGGRRARERDGDRRFGVTPTPLQGQRGLESSIRRTEGRRRPTLPSSIGCTSRDGQYSIQRCNRRGR